MKKNLILGIVVLALAAVGLTLFLSNPGDNTTSMSANHDFAIPDTASITKIVISDKSPNKVSLEKIDGVWTVDGKSPARVDAVNVLLETFHHIDMRSYVTEESKPEILKRMDVFGKHVQVYSGDKLLKSFLVGTETPDQLGTYMKLDDSSEPFAMHLPGFNGYLNSRFFADAESWRMRTIWGFDNRNIKTIAVNYRLQPSQSFRIEVENKEPKIYDVNGELVENANLGLLYEYLAAFRNTRYEGAIIPSDGIYNKMDSVIASGEIYSIFVEPIKGKPVELKTYRVKAQPDTYDIHDNPRKWDPDRLYGVINGEIYVLVQNFGLQNVTRNVGYFK